MTGKEKRHIEKTLSADYIPRKALADAAVARIKALGLSRDDAAKVVDDAPSQLSRLMTGHFIEFSADRLVKMLGRLGCSVTLGVFVPGGKIPSVQRRALVEVRYSAWRGGKVRKYRGRGR